MKTEAFLGALGFLAVLAQKSGLPSRSLLKWLAYPPPINENRSDILVARSHS